MIRTQIHLPAPLLERLRNIARAKEISVAEIIRRGMETYAKTFPDTLESEEPWKYPVLPRGSGGFLIDPATINVEADAIEERCKSIP